MSTTIKLRFIGNLLLVLILIFGIAGFGVLTTQAAGSNQRVIVTFEDPINENARGMLKSMGVKIVKEMGFINGAVVLIPEHAIPVIRSFVGVKAIEKDVRVFTQHHRNGHNGGPGGGGDGGGNIPTQPAETLEWGVDRIDANLTWGTSRGTDIKVAIIDTGIDKKHKDLLANIKGGINFVAKGPSWKQADPNKWDDDNGHGTHVAGIIAAINNEIGVIGTAPEAHLYGVKVLDQNGSGYLSDVISGIGWAVEKNMNVVNMSLGCDCDSIALKNAVDNAYNAGLVLVAAAGNSGDGNGATNDVIYPAKYASVIAVSATDVNDDTPSWSSEGEEVEIAAPGVSIRSTWNDGFYNTISGTSMASPHVAGTVALMLSAGVSASNVRAVLQATADDLGTAGHDNFYGYGLVNAEESVTGTQTGI